MPGRAGSARLQASAVLTPGPPGWLGIPAHRLGGGQPWRKPCRQLGQAGCQPSSRFALAFDEPRICVIIETPTSPAASRPSHTGSRYGAFAPTACARNGSHSATRPGSSSTML
jgi:hypothetical protein